MSQTKSNITAAREAGQNIIAEILANYPCPQCGAVEVLRDADISAATCDCGRQEGCNERWELADIWSQMSAEEKSAATATRKDIAAI